MLKNIKETDHEFVAGLSLQANIENIEKLKEYGKEIYLKYLSQKRDFFEYLICLDEVFCNCLIHGYQGNEGPVKVSFLVDEKYLVTEISDYGVGISDYYTKEFTGIKENLLSEGGRGLVIVKNIADKVFISKNKNKGTTVSFYFERVYSSDN